MIELDDVIGGSPSTLVALSGRPWRIAVTGASGYIGRRLVARARSHGHEVIELGRRPTKANAAWLRFDLLSPGETRLPEGTDVLVHLAAITSADEPTVEGAEVAAAQRLIELAIQRRTVIVFVSSQTANPNSPTAYGRIKWHIERAVLAAGGWVVRPGLVYGGVAQGLFGTLIGDLRRTRLVPQFFPSPRVAPIHVDDLVEGLMRVVGMGLAQRKAALGQAVSAEVKFVSSYGIPGSPEGRERLFCLGADEAVPFADFLRLVASIWLRRTVLAVPVPALLPRLGASLFPPRWGISGALGRLVSLLDLPSIATSADLEYLGLVLRDPISGLHRSGNDRRRALAREGRALMAYVLGAPPQAQALRRYIRAIEALRNGAPLGVPRWALAAPMLVAGLEGSSSDSTRRSELTWRIDAATALAEASTQGARRFLALGGARNPVASLLGITRSVAREAVWRVLRLGLRVLDAAGRVLRGASD